MARKTNIALRLAIAASALVGASSPANAFPKFHAKWLFHERAALESAALTPDTVADAHGFLASSDGTCLFFRYWPAAVAGDLRKDADPQEVVLVLHGIGAHAGP